MQFKAIDETVCLDSVSHSFRNYNTAREYRATSLVRTNGIKMETLPIKMPMTANVLF